MIKYKCRSCGVKLETDDSLSGKEEACPECGKVNPVPLSKDDRAKERQQEQEEERRQQEVVLRQQKYKREHLREEQQALGHRSIASTVRYTQVPNETLKAALEAV